MRVEGYGFVDVSAALSRSSRTELMLLLGAIIFDGSAALNRSSHRVFLLRFISGIDLVQLCRVTALVQLCRVTALDIRVDGRDILLRYSQSKLANLATRSNNEPGHSPITSPLDLTKLFAYDGLSSSSDIVGESRVRLAFIFRSGVGFGVDQLLGASESTWCRPAPRRGRTVSFVVDLLSLS